MKYLYNVSKRIIDITIPESLANGKLNEAVMNFR